MLKNEFGDVSIDADLAQQQNIFGVQEMLNGCLCCTLVGQLKGALEEIVQKYQPDRILVETSGSAFPAPMAWQLREMEREGLVPVRLDSIVTVIDCVHFRGYEDTSYTAKLQAQYTDLILLNKWEEVFVRGRVFEVVIFTPFLPSSLSPLLPPPLDDRFRSEILTRCWTMCTR